MKLKKHLDRLVIAFLTIMDARDEKRFGRGELIDLLNEKIDDTRLTINQYQISKVVNQQKKYDCKKGRDNYEFSEKDKNKESGNDGSI